jgi:hypothetical protein
MAIQTQDFYANGLPTGIQANAGIVYTNIADGKQYKQKTIPFGSNWVSLGTTAYFYYQSSGGLPSQSGKAGKYLKTDGTTASWEAVIGGVTDVTATAPVVSSGGTTPVISMPKATALQSGYLSSTDWNTFNDKGSGTVTSVSGTAPIVSSGGATPAISIPQATSVVNGYLSSADWNTFNNKSRLYSGTVEVNFGATPGTNMIVTTVALASVQTASIINVFMASEATTTHNAYEHSIVPMKLTAGNIVNGVSFDIIAMTELRLTGTFKVKYTIL